MVRFVVVTVVALLVAGPVVPDAFFPTSSASVALVAQEREIRSASLPGSYEHRLLELYQSDRATRYRAAARIRSGQDVAGPVAATGGPLRIEGRVDGDVAMVGGDVVVGPSGVVSGDVVVVDGEVRLLEGATVEGEMVEFSSPARESLHADRRGSVDDDRPGWRGDREGRRGDRRGDRSDGSAELTLRTGPSYNRVEGLGLMFGPVIQTRGDHPLRLEAFGIYRTAAESALGTDPWGYDVRATQFLDAGERFRFGGSAFSVVDPINRWQLRDTEASLAALGFHQDFRDHFGREGWSAFVGVRPVSDLDLQIEYRDARHASVGAADPWTLFNDSHLWRAQPLAGEGNLQSLLGTVELDLRDDREDPFSGWYARAQVRRALGGDLALPALAAVLPEGGSGGVGIPLPSDMPATDLSTDFTTAFVDLRHYAPVTDGSQLNFRVVGGGNVEQGPLPPQFQHALGGPGSLPGFSPFAADCGARSGVGSRDGITFYPGFGCDRFVLGQIEFRGHFSLDLDFGEPDRDERDREWWDQDIDLSPRWMVFLDAGQGWSYDDGVAGGRVTTGRLYDAGAGFLIDDVGVYFAVPLNESVEREARFFVRLQRRF